MSPSLHDLFARGGSLEWFEAVAVVQALCKRLLEHAPASGVRVPDLRQIVLTDDGNVDVTGDGPEGQSPVFRVGQLLTTLAAGGPMPVPLRLLALTAVSPTPPYDSILQLTTALEYYERPDRSAIIRAVYERLQQLPAAAATPVALEEIPTAMEPPAVVPRSPWWRRHRAGVAAGVAAVLVAAAVGAWPLARSKVPWVAVGSRQVAHLAGATTDAVVKTVSSGIESLRARLGGGSAADARAEAPPPAPAPLSPMPRSTRAPLPSSGGWPNPGGVAAPASPAASPDAVEWVVDQTVVVRLPPLPALDVDIASGDLAIYSAADLDVLPPGSVRPRLPTEPPPGVRLESLPLIEVVVSASGEVEFARLKTPSPDVRASMMISAVKTWRFEPATRNGRPVRYRALIRLTNQ